jgi:hypothetical protein
MDGMTAHRRLGFAIGQLGCLEQCLANTWNGQDHWPSTGMPYTATHLKCHVWLWHDCCMQCHAG